MGRQPGIEYAAALLSVNLPAESTSDFFQVPTFEIHRTISHFFLRILISTLANTLASI